MTKKIVVIVGPTATGKSALAVRLAKKIGGEIISADSRQVYRGLNIGTGKITKKEMRGVSHHLLDVVDPKKQFSAADFVRLGCEKIAEIVSRDKTPIICGGTGFYISTLLGEIELPPAPPNPKLRKKLAKKSRQELFEMLKKLETAPAVARALAGRRSVKIDQHNPRRLIRAIEIIRNGHTPNLCYSNRCVYEKIQEKFNVLKIGLRLPPEKLKEKIRIRLFARIRAGMIAEVRRLHMRGLSWKRMEELGLEYRYLSRFLRGKISKDEMIEKLTTEIWRYAKRQMTWFKRDKKIHWFLPIDSKKIWALTQSQSPNSNR